MSEEQNFVAFIIVVLFGAGLVLFKFGAFDKLKYTIDAFNESRHYYMANEYLKKRVDRPYPGSDSIATKK